MKFESYLLGVVDNRGRNPEYYMSLGKYPVIDNYLIKNELYPKISNVKRYIDDNLRNNFIRENVYAGMVLMTLVGEGIGNVTTAPNDQIVIIQNTIGFKVNPKFLNDKYLYYYLKSQNEHIRQFNRGSGQPSIRKTDILGMDVDFPSIECQEKIVDILSCFDEKIENNQRINNNLQQQIKLLCDSWLYEYQPLGGQCPNDWEQYQLSQIADFYGGYSYKGNELCNSATAMATIKNFDRNGGFKFDGYKEIKPSDKLKVEHQAELFDILVAHTDLTQNAEVIGNAEMVTSTNGYERIIYSMDLVKVLPKRNSPLSRFLLAAILQNARFKSHCLGYVNGTTVLHLSKKALPEYKLFLPTNLSILKPLDNALGCLYRKIVQISAENLQLKSLRDALLPKLMSGEIDVSDVEI